MTVFLSPERGVRPTEEVIQAIVDLLNTGVVSKCVIDPTGIGGPVVDKLTEDGYRVLGIYPSHWREII